MSVFLIYVALLVLAIYVPFLVSFKLPVFTKYGLASSVQHRNILHPSQLHIQTTHSPSTVVTYMSLSDESDESGTEVDTEDEVDSTNEEVLDQVEVVSTNTTDASNTTNSTVEVDPKAEIIKAKISALTAQEIQLESAIAAERVNLLRTKDRISESGKTGYFIVQAQVAEFLVSFYHSNYSILYMTIILIRICFPPNTHSFVIINIIIEKERCGTKDPCQS